MNFWTFAISDEPTLPDLAIGYVRASTAADALDKPADQRANVYQLPDDFCWPTGNGDVLTIPECAEQERLELPRFKKLWNSEFSYKATS